MLINLKSVPVAYINLKTYPNRNKSMINMLDSLKLEYTRVEGVTGEDVGYAYDPIGESHIKASEVYPLPFIILEDDCVPFNVKKQINVPDDADVVFLGASTGTSNNMSPKFVKITNDVWRLYDMSSMHAVLYLTTAGLGWLRNAFEHSKMEQVGFDIATARMMPSVNVYGLNKPFWYQHDALETKTTLADAEFVNGSAGGNFPDYKEPLTFEKKNGK